jgi:glycosyltransferase involved in cell wall biosynthesis
MIDGTPVVLDARVLSGSGGGPDKTLINSPRFLERDGYRMLCVYLHHPEDPGFAVLQSKAAKRGVDLISVPDHGIKDWRVMKRLVSICREKKVDIWHGHDYKTNILGLILKRFHRMRLVTTAHGWVHHTSKTPLYYWLDKRSLRYYERVYCVSPDLVDECIANEVPADRCLLLENGIDLEDYSRSLTTKAAKEALGISPDRKLIGAAGRLSPEKGFDLLISAVHRLYHAGHDVELWIVGEGVEKENLQTQINSLQMQDRIKLTGYRSDLQAIYQGMDVYALSSYREGLPNVLLEAMALEVPVVATAINGVPRLIRDREEGLLIQPGQVGTLVEAIQEVFNSGALASELTRNARQTLEDRYDFAVRMSRLREDYDRLLNRIPARRPVAVGSAAL